MGWLIVAVVATTAITVGTTALAGKQQQDMAENAIEQARLDKVASDNATDEAVQDAQRATESELTQQARELFRDKGSAVARQASSGVAGVVQEKQLRNVDMQNTFDVAKIKQDGDNMVVNVLNQGGQNIQAIQSAENTARSNRPSNTSIAVASIAGGVGTGLSVYSAGKGK